jgi:small redox-active disulfide protein 2
MTIKILGSGCVNCQTLYKRTEEELKELHLEATLEKVTDIQKIVSYGIMRTPGLVIDEKVVSYGPVPKTEDIKKLILSNTVKA